MASAQSESKPPRRRICPVLLQFPGPGGFTTTKARLLRTWWVGRYIFTPRLPACALCLPDPGRGRITKAWRARDVRRD